MNISLIGMMGSGKSTIGKLLASVLKNMKFIDMDSLIVSSENRSINDIFSIDGESYFRKVESDILFKIIQEDNQIISTGGGIIKADNNLSLLKEKSITIYLEASAEVLFERVKNNNERPLLNVNDIKNKIEGLLKERETMYNLAHIKINTDNKTPDIIVKEIIKELNL